MAGLARRGQGGFQSPTTTALAADHGLQAEALAATSQGPLRAGRKDARRAEPRGQPGRSAPDQRLRSGVKELQRRRYGTEWGEAATVDRAGAQRLNGGQVRSEEHTSELQSLRHP